MPPPRKLCGKRVLKDFTLAEVFTPHLNSQCNAFAQFIGNFAGVTSRSTERTGFAKAHTALTSLKAILNCFARHSPKIGFTLAEVLITLGIIGVVAALTLPPLIENHQKQVTVNKLKKFYSLMSQAVLMWQNETGLMFDDPFFVSSDIRNADSLENWYLTYMDKNIKSISKDKIGIHYKVGLADGSGFVAYIGGTNYINFFYCTEYKYCAPESFDGRRTFLFAIYKGKFYTSSHVYQNQTREQLLNGCKYGNSDDPSVSSKGRRHSCARLIEYDGWQIKDDYPWTQTMLER